MAGDVRSTRPLAVIETEILLTRRALVVCGQLVKVALDERLALLEDGWPATHLLCVRLDEVAAQWAGERDHQQRALAALYVEQGPNDGAVSTGEDPTTEP